MNFKRALSFVVFCVVIFFLLEGVTRLFLKINQGISFFASHEDYVASRYYPEILEIRQGVPAEDYEVFDILFLGGSVLHEDWGSVEQELKKTLNITADRPFKIHNFSIPAHSTRDSLFKYALLSEQSFDLVVLYHGINEVRANNCPPHIFESNYSHYSWYRSINLFMSHSWDDFSMMIPILKEVEFRFYERLIHVQRVPTHQPRLEWLGYGKKIMSKESFDENIQTIMAVAEAKEESLLLMTFASYVPKDYSLEKFQGRQLDYDGMGVPIELWGDSMNVLKGIKVHNNVIRGLVQANPHVLYIDQDMEMPSEGKYYRDICHLNLEGSKRFVRNMKPEILKLMKE